VSTPNTAHHRSYVEDEHGNRSFLPTGADVLEAHDAARAKRLGRPSWFDSRIAEYSPEQHPDAAASEKGAIFKRRPPLLRIAIAIVGALAVAVALAGCGGAGCPEPGTFTAEEAPGCPLHEEPQPITPPGPNFCTNNPACI